MADIVLINPPNLKIDVEFNQTIPLFSAGIPYVADVYVSAFFGGGIHFRANVSAGFDTSGLKRGSFLGGIYLGDFDPVDGVIDPTDPERPELTLSADIHAGIDAGVGIAPILPGISDHPELLADVVRAARDAGAIRVWCNVLYLQPGTREHFLEHLARDWPALLPRYLELYRVPYPGRAVTAPLKEEVAALARRFAIADRRERPLEPPTPPEQLQLAM